MILIRNLYALDHTSTTYIVPLPLLRAKLLLPYLPQMESFLNGGRLLKENRVDLGYSGYLEAKKA